MVKLIFVPAAGALRCSCGAGLSGQQHASVHSRTSVKLAEGNIVVGNSKGSSLPGLIPI